MGLKLPVTKLELMYHFLPCSAAVEFLPVFGKRQPVERLGHILSRDYLARLDINYQQVMRAVTRVQHHRKLAFGVHGDVNREITDLHLAPCGAQGPLIVKQNGAIGLSSRGGAAGERCRGMFSCGLPLRA